MAKFSEQLRQRFEPLNYRFFLIPQANRKHEKLIKEIRKKGRASVAFLVSSLPMWRFQELYDRLNEDSRFDLQIVLFPFPTFSPEQRNDAIQQLRAFFDNLGIPYLDLSGSSTPGKELRDQFNPDVLFYPQPYNHLYDYNDIDAPFFADKLLCYIPYAMLTANDPSAYKNYLNNIAWRLFFQAESRKDEAAAVLYNRGKNIRVVGDPMTDVFSLPASRDPWKPQDKEKKRVIWAPHFSLSPSILLHRDAFSWLSDFMLDVAERYQQQIQFAFKPHPRLFSVLSELPGWGNERAKAYYAKWAEGANTQLEVGSYIDLFKTSDAMIHDSSSFTVEYHFTGKPVLFTAIDLEPVLKGLNSFGKDAVMAHYYAKTTDDVISFIENVVLKQEDSMEGQRKVFYTQYLLPPGNGSVSENIYRDIVTSIWG